MKGALAKLRGVYRESLLWPLISQKSHRFFFSGRSVSIKSPSLRQLELMRDQIFTDAHCESQKRYFQAIGFREGSAIIDVGANIGYTALVYALIFPGSEVLALEPSRFNFRYLAQNCRGFRNVKMFNFGAHEKRTEAVLSMPSADQNPRAARPEHRRNSGLLSMYGAEEDGSETAFFEPLDDFMESHPLRSGIGFIKIDVEGNEFKVLKGAKRLLSRHMPVIEAEMNPRALAMASVTYGEIRNYLKNFGYRPYVFDGRDLVPFGSDDMNETVNVVFKKG